jgi:hypothetical protein
MRKRKAFNPKRRIEGFVELAVLNDLLATVKYGAGNPEHKRSKVSPDLESSGARPYKTQCHEAAIEGLSVARELLREGVRQGLISCQKRDKFPQNIWAVTTDGVPLEAQLENQGQGTYHGYPMPSIDPFADEILKRWKKPK